VSIYEKKRISTTIIRGQKIHMIAATRISFPIIYALYQNPVDLGNGLDI
jgi:hypothetical protein